ncbi:hypothetical protein GW17_00012814 [Ensete ventricosum]|nr:hypothetical protein GW17_00012814 [Ensete ventricosum]
MQDTWCSFESMQRLCTLEAQLSLLLRVSHNYGKHGAQILLSMCTLEHLGSSGVVSLQIKGGSKKKREENLVPPRAALPRFPALFVAHGQRIARVIHRLRAISSPAGDSFSPRGEKKFAMPFVFIQVKNKIVREVLDFVKGHQSIFDQILREDVLVAEELTLERINLVVSILSKVS